MTQACAEKPLAYRFALAASVTLAASWLSYFIYLNGVSITKQSVHMGPITFYAAVLLAVSSVSLGVLAASLGLLARRRHRLSKRAAMWGVLAVTLAILVFVFTRPLINAAA